MCIQTLIRDGFAAVGIVEEWNTTMTLFDKALDMPEVEWVRQFQEQGSKNTSGKRKKDLKTETLRNAWTDVELKKYMKLDLLLYEQAVAVFREQVRSYGLS